MYKKKEMFDKFRQVLNALEENNLKPDRSIYMLLLNTYLDRKKYDKAWTTFVAMRRDGIQLNHQQYGRLVADFIPAGRYAFPWVCETFVHVSNAY